MRGLPPIPRSERHRLRRFDVVMLGGALPGLVAAVRLGMRGARVLVLEEEEALAELAALREPFFPGSGERGSLLGTALAELGIPLIDRRRTEPAGPAYQVVLPDARIDVGDPEWSAEELARWGIADSAEARGLVEGLAGAARAECGRLLQAPIVHTPLRLPRVGRRSATHTLSPRPPARHDGVARGLPERARHASGRLAHVLEAQLRVLSHCGDPALPEAARARLLGAPLASEAVFDPGPGGLHGLLRRRIEALHGEFKPLAADFELRSAFQQPAVCYDDAGEVWVGRALVLNARRDRIAAALGGKPIPDFLRAEPAARQRLTLHFRIDPQALPEGMSRRVIYAPDPETSSSAAGVVSLRVAPGSDAGDALHLFASRVIDASEADLTTHEAEIEACLDALLPLSRGAIAREKTRTPLWDCDRWLDAPRAGRHWPGETNLRLASRPPVYALASDTMACLGFEGDVLLGWRGGDAIASDLG